MNTEMPVGNAPHSLARKAGIFTISRAVTILSQLLAAVILTRVLPKEDFAVITFLLLIYSTVQAFGQLGLPDSVFYFFEKLPANFRKSLSLLIARMLLWLGLAGVAVLLVLAWYGSTKEGFGAVSGLVWVFVLLLLLELPTMPLPNMLIALDRAKSAAWLNIYIGVSQFLAMTLPLFTENKLQNITIGLGIYGILRLAVSAIIFLQQYRNVDAVQLPTGMARELLAYSVPHSIAQIFWSLNRQIDKYIVQYFLPVAVYAEYTAGAYEVPFIPTIAYSVAAVMMPQLVSHHLSGRKTALLELWNSSIRKISLIVLPLVMVFIVAAEEFMVLLFSKEYINAAIPFRIYTLILLQRVASYSSIQKALNTNKHITYSSIILLVSNVLLCFPLVKVLGIAGPPVAALIANLLSWWYAMYSIKTTLNVGFWDVFPIRFYLKVLLIAFLAGVPAFLLKYQSDFSEAWKFALVVVIYFPIYLLLGRVTGLLTEEDRHRLWSILKWRS
jgi:O-antigen/teichoic acid export membrane protein